MLQLVVVVSGLLIKEIFVLIQQQIELLIVLINHLSLVLVVDFDPFVFQISDNLLRFAQIVAQAQELDE